MYSQSSAGTTPANIQHTVKAEIVGAVLFSVTSVPKFLPKIKRTKNVGIVLVHLPGTRVYRKFLSAEPPILEKTENITAPKISAFTVRTTIVNIGKMASMKLPVVQWWPKTSHLVGRKLRQGSCDPRGPRISFGNMHAVIEMKTGRYFFDLRVGFLRP